MKEIVKTIILGVLLTLNANAVFAVSRMIVQCKPVATAKPKDSKAIIAELNKPLNVSMLREISVLAGAKASEVGVVGVGGHIVKLDKDISPAKFKVLVKTLEAKPNVKYVEEDKKLKAVSILSGTDVRLSSSVSPSNFTFTKQIIIPNILG